MMKDRLAIPFIGPKGNVYDLRFRCIQSHDCKEERCPKYLGLDGVETRIYNAQALVAPTDYIFVTEGELDAATLTVCGWPAIGLLGANSWKKHYPRLLAGFSKVVLVADGDDAGHKLASTFRRAMPSAGNVILCQQGDDINSVFVREGREGLVALLKGDEDE
jgi:DNA primase